VLCDQAMRPVCAFAAHATYFKLQLEHFCVEKALYFSRFSPSSARRIDVDASLFPRFTRAMTEKLSCLSQILVFVAF